MQLTRHIYESLLVKPFTAMLYGLGLSGALVLLLSDIAVRVPALVPIQRRNSQR